MKFVPHQVEKPWGRTEIPAIFGSTNGRRVGEIWFEAAGTPDLSLLVKYIFTSEKLSVQVHPDDRQAKARGLPRGKTECWYILDAEPGAVLGLGVRQPMLAAELRARALDGSIEHLLDWKPVVAGDFFFVPANTIHAIGAGIALLEFQQNSDVTYRLYDYGRPRELHLEEGVAVADISEYPDSRSRRSGEPLDTVLLNGPHFSLVRASSADSVPPSLEGRRRWVMPLEGTASSADEQASAGECLLIDPGAPVTFSAGSTVLIGVEGSL